MKKVQELIIANKLLLDALTAKQEEDSAKLEQILTIIITYKKD